MNDVSVVLGPNVSKYTVPDEDILYCVECIKDCVKDIKLKYIQLGFLFSQLKYNSLGVSSLGYSNYEHLIEANTGMDRSAISRCINVYKRFGSCDDNGVLSVAEPYKAYSYSQLSEMVSLEDSSLEKITPDMTIQVIRSYKQYLRKSDKKDKVVNVATSQQTSAKASCQSVCMSRKDLLKMVNILLLDFNKKFSNVYCILGEQPDNGKDVYINVRIADGGLESGKYKLTLTKCKDS